MEENKTNEIILKTKKLCWGKGKRSELFPNGRNKPERKYDEGKYLEMEEMKQEEMKQEERKTRKLLRKGRNYANRN